ncbi:hypothetical protein BGX33_001762, partial [Mortierella sp. NVP41]
MSLPTVSPNEHLRASVATVINTGRATNGIEQIVAGDTSISELLQTRLVACLNGLGSGLLDPTVFPDVLTLLNPISVGTSSSMQSNQPVIDEEREVAPSNTIRYYLRQAQGVLNAFTPISVQNIYVFYIGCTRFSPIGRAKADQSRG